MKNRKQPLYYLMVTLLFVLVACKSPEKKESLYPENEIPISTTSDEAMQQFVTGLDLFHQGNAQKARPYFEKALALDPNFVSAQRFKAFCSRSSKEWSENRDKLLAMYDNATEGEKIQLNMIKAGMEGDDDKRFELSKSLVETYPNSAQAYGILANAYRDQENFEEERKHWAKAMEHNPDYLPAIRNLGNSYLFTTPRDFKKAEAYAAMFVAKVPNSAKAQIALGDTYRAQNDLTKALASYNKAAELDPEDEVALSKAGHVNSYLGNYDAARKNFQDSRALSEFGDTAYDFEGFTYLYAGDPKKASDFLQDAVKKVSAMDIPESNKTGVALDYNYFCAMIAMHHGDKDQLKEMVEKMKPLSLQMGKDVGAKSAILYQQANMQFWDAMVSASEGNNDAAVASVELIKTTLESINDPYKSKLYHRAHTLVNYLQGDYKKAMEHTSHLDPDDIHDKYVTAMINNKTGNTDKANAILKDLADYNFNQIEYALIRKEVKDMLASNK